jgi:hypothetical protein
MRKQNQEMEYISEALTAESPKDRLKKLMEEETKVVKGRFRCFETPGGSLRVQIKKYKEVPMFDKTLIDNEVYEVPLYVARHLNGVDHLAKSVNGKINTCSYPVHGHIMVGNDWAPASFDQNGNPLPTTQVTKWVRRYGFESLQFDALEAM